MSTAAVLRRDVSAYDGSESVRIPRWVSDLKSFRRWAYSDEFPSRGWITYCQGDIWVDMSMEEHEHNQIKTEYCAVLAPLSKQARLGRYYSDRYRVSNPRADLSNEPDGMFVLFESFRTGRARLVQGRRRRFVELEGSPDMTLEIVSQSSVAKDFEWLREAYWRAGVQEYWLVDARVSPLRFDILRRGPRGFVAARKRDGWMKSTLFGKEFRLIEAEDQLGMPDYTLEVR